MKVKTIESAVASKARGRTTTNQQGFTLRVPKTVDDPITPDNEFKRNP
jgi:hypothetical protein